MQCKELAPRVFIQVSAVLKVILVIQLLMQILQQQPSIVSTCSMKLHNLAIAAQHGQHMQHQSQCKSCIWKHRRAVLSYQLPTGDVYWPLQETLQETAREPSSEHLQHPMRMQGFMRFSPQQSPSGAAPPLRLCAGQSVLHHAVEDCLQLGPSAAVLDSSWLTQHPCSTASWLTHGPCSAAAADPSKASAWPNTAAAALHWLHPHNTILGETHGMGQD